MFDHTISSSLSDHYSKAGQKGWQGLLTKVNNDFEIIDVWPASDISDDLDYYLKRKQTTHDQHGMGPFLLAGTEYLKGQKNCQYADNDYQLDKCKSFYLHSMTAWTSRVYTD